MPGTNTDDPIWLDLPMTFQPALVAAGMPCGWDDRYGARICVMPQDPADGRDRNGAVHWFEIDPHHVFPVGGAHEDEAGRVVLDGIRCSCSDASYPAAPPVSGITLLHGASAGFHGSWIADPA
jgi:carotenoid cleavage dioxygenase